MRQLLFVSEDEVKQYAEGGFLSVLRDKRKIRIDVAVKINVRIKNQIIVGLLKL